MQVGNESFGIARRALDIEDYIDIARRHRGWVLGPTLCGLVMAVVIAFLWPDTYQSMGTIRVVPPQVPEKLVPTNVNTQMAQRINSMANSILSRNTLTNIITSMNLYPADRNRYPMEDILERMRGDIEIGTVRPLSKTGMNAPMNAFTVGFSYGDRYASQKVARDLLSRFINENIQERSNQSTMTTQFLKDQRDEAKGKLDALDQHLTQFRITNAGRLPEQLQGNLQHMTALEGRLSGLNASIGRVNQDKAVLESEVRLIRERIKNVSNFQEQAASRAAVDGTLERIDRQIMQVEQSVARVKEAYKPNHPDVKRAENQLVLLQKQRDDVAQKMEVKLAEAGTQPRPAGPGRAKEVATMEAEAQRMQILLQSKDMEIESLVREMTEVDRKIKELTKKIETSPIGEQLYTQLMRDYNLTRDRYNELNVKLSQSETATDLENRKQGETLELLDDASLPETPSAPIRPLIISLGLLIGFILGAGAVTSRELRDTSLKNLKDVRAYAQFTLLGSVPLLENDLVVRRRRRLAWLVWSTACLVSAVVMAGSIYYYYSGKL